MFSELANHLLDMLFLVEYGREITWQMRCNLSEDFPRRQHHLRTSKVASSILVALQYEDPWDRWDFGRSISPWSGPRCLDEVLGLLWLF